MARKYCQTLAASNRSTIKINVQTCNLAIIRCLLRVWTQCSIMILLISHSSSIPPSSVAIKSILVCSHRWIEVWAPKMKHLSKWRLLLRVRLWRKIVSQMLIGFLRIKASMTKSKWWKKSNHAAHCGQLTVLLIAHRGESMSPNSLTHSDRKDIIQEMFCHTTPPNKITKSMI